MQKRKKDFRFYAKYYYFCGTEKEEKLLFLYLKEQIELVKMDVVDFISDPHELDIWSNDYFLQLADRIKFV